MLLRMAGRLLGNMAHVIRTRKLHKSRPHLVAALLLVPTTLGGVFLVSHLEEAPLSGRTQLVFLDSEQEMELGVMAASQVFKEEKDFILPKHAPETQTVHDVAVELLKGLQAASSSSTRPDPRLQERIAALHWEVSVIQSDVANAFVVPSGSIFVYTALLDQLETRGGLAFVLAHELSHALARHSVEKMGVLCLGAFFVDFCAGFLGPSTHRYLQYMLLPYLQALVLDLPYSRALETEADTLGVRLMATAGYDPHEAVEAWKRMEKAAAVAGGSSGGGGGGVPEFVSTHPSHQTRIDRLTALLPEALVLQQQALASKAQRGERIPDSRAPIASSSSSSSSSFGLGQQRQRSKAELAKRRAGSARAALQASSLVVGPSLAPSLPNNEE